MCPSILYYYTCKLWAMFAFKAWKGRKWESNTRNVSQCYQVPILKNCKGACVFIRGGVFPALVFFHFCGGQALLIDSDDAVMSGTY